MNKTIKLEICDECLKPTNGKLYKEYVSSDPDEYRYILICDECYNKRQDEINNYEPGCACDF